MPSSRRTFSRLTAAALLACVGFVWARSHWVIDSVERISVASGSPPSLRGWIVCTDNGDVYIQAWSNTGPFVASYQSRFEWALYRDREHDGHPIFGRGSTI